MNKVYIHIGLPKCGSSAVQLALSSARAQLSAAGYDYPILPSRDPERDSAAHQRLVKSLQSASREGKACTVLPRVLKEAEEKGAHSIILSAEAFYGVPKLSPLAIGTALDRFDVEGVAFCRPYDAFIISAYKQQVKGRHKYSESYSQFKQDKRFLKKFFNTSIADRIYERFTILKAKRMVVNSSVDRDVVGLMNEFLGIDMLSSQGGVNISLGEVATAFLAKRNETSSDNESRRLRHALSSADLSDVAPGFSLLSAEELAELHERAWKEHELLVSRFGFDGAAPKPLRTDVTRNTLTDAELAEIDRRVQLVSRNNREIDGAAAAA